jgi:hypothetical protein
VIEDARLKASNAAARAVTRAGSVTHDWSGSVQNVVSGSEPRDKILLGAAGIAVLAALSIAYQRRANEQAEV